MSPDLTKSGSSFSDDSQVVDIVYEASPSKDTKTHNQYLQRKRTLSIPSPYEGHAGSARKMSAPEHSTGNPEGRELEFPCVVHIEENHNWKGSRRQRLEALFKKRKTTEGSSSRGNSASIVELGYRFVSCFCHCRQLTPVCYPYLSVIAQGHFRGK
jgi:hypothetical protein